jgi:hypothetical protein
MVIASAVKMSFWSPLMTAVFGGSWARVTVPPSVLYSAV